MPPKQVDISTLEPRQLQSIHEQIQNEMENLAQSSVALQRAAGEYGNSGRALEQLSEQKEGKILQACIQFLHTHDDECHAFKLAIATTHGSTRV